MTTVTNKLLTVGIFAPVSSSPQEGGNLIGVSPASLYPLQALVQGQPGWTCRLLTTGDLEDANVLDDVHVLVLPGGDPRALRNAISPAARRCLHDWKKDPSSRHHRQVRGLVGICAGAVVACGRGHRGIELVSSGKVRMVNDNRIGRTALCSMVELEMDHTVLPWPSAGHTFYMPYMSGPLFVVEDTCCGGTTTSDGTTASTTDVTTTTTDLGQVSDLCRRGMPDFSRE